MTTPADVKPWSQTAVERGQPPVTSEELVRALDAGATGTMSHPEYGPYRIITAHEHSGYLVRDADPNRDEGGYRQSPRALRADVDLMLSDGMRLSIDR